jgi:hypothetical protein
MKILPISIRITSGSGYGFSGHFQGSFYLLIFFRYINAFCRAQSSAGRPPPGPSVQCATVPPSTTPGTLSTDQSQLRREALRSECQLWALLPHPLVDGTQARPNIFQPLRVSHSMEESSFVSCEPSPGS